MAVVFAGGYLIRYLTRNLTAGMERPGETAEQVKNAGMYIGWLERFLAVTAILVQSPSLVGLILTGKSIAKISGVEGTICGIFPYRLAPQHWTGCSRRPGTRTAMVRNHDFEVIKGSFSPARDARVSVFSLRLSLGLRVSSSGRYAGLLGHCGQSFKGSQAVGMVVSVGHHD